MWDERVVQAFFQEGKPTLMATIGLFSLTAAFALAAFAMLTGKRKGGRAGGASLRQGMVRHPEEQGKGRFWQAVYLLLSKSRITRMPLQAIRNRLELSSGYDERGLRRQSAVVLVMTGGLLALVMGLFAVVSRDPVLCAIFAGMLGFFADTVLELTVTRAGNRLMRQQIRFHEQLRHRYYEERSIEGALEAACETMRDEKAHDMYTQGEKLLDMLNAADTEAAFESFRLTAPNRYLKLLAGMCAMTREYGDAREEGGSVFLRGLGHLSEEIRSELFKRERLTYALRSLGLLTLLPLFLLRPIRQWAGGSFAPMERFYAQEAGTLLELLMLIIALACHAGIRTLQHPPEAQVGKRQNRRWEDEWMRSFMQPLLQRLVPARSTLAHQRMVLLLKRAVSPLRVQDVVLRQAMAAISCFFLMLALLVFLKTQQTHRVLHELDLPAGFLGGRLSDEDQLLLTEQARQDRELLLSLPRNVTRQELALVVASSGVPQALQEEWLDRLMSKRQALSRYRFWWWKLALCFIGMACGWQLPILSLHYQARIRRMDMEDEVSRFQTMILMLMHMPRMDVEEILQWMEMFSLHFREPLQSCLSDYHAGAAEALEALKEKVAFEPMAALVGDLMLAASNLPIREAFEELDSEKQWTKEKRKALNEQVVERKRNLGHLIGFMPLYALIGLYLMLPMIVASLSEMQLFYKQMSSF